MEGPEKRKLSASSSDRKSNTRTLNPSSTEAEAPSLPAGKKASSKSAERVRPLHKPLNPDATIIVPTTLSRSPVAEATERQDVDDQEAPTDVGYNDIALGHGQLRNISRNKSS